MVASGKAGGAFSLVSNHAWNIVEYEKELYHCDITWDLCGYVDRQIYSYQYFGLDDSEMSLDCYCPPKLTYFYFSCLSRV